MTTTEHLQVPAVDLPAWMVERTVQRIEEQIAHAESRSASPVDMWAGEAAGLRSALAILSGYAQAVAKVQGRP